MRDVIVSIAAISHWFGSVLVGRCRGRSIGGQTFRNHSGIPTMYFRLMVQRSTILMGTRAVHRNRCIITLKRIGPISAAIFLKTVFPRIGGSTTK